MFKTIDTKSHCTFYFIHDFAYTHVAILYLDDLYIRKKNSTEAMTEF